MGVPSPSSEDQLLHELGVAVDAARRPIREIEVGIALSIALGKMRPAVSCGGCAAPLEFRGIPAKTNARLSSPFQLVFGDDPPTGS
jgi:hypothetical protein